MTSLSLVTNMLADISPAGVLPLAYGMTGTGRSVVLAKVAWAELRP